MHFELELDAAARGDEEMEALLNRVAPAVEAAVAAASGAAVQAHVSGWSYPHGGLRRVGRAAVISYGINKGIAAEGDAPERGQAALAAVLEGGDRRLRQLYDVYLLGVRAVQSIAPVVGLWAFSTVLEEKAPPNRHNLAHVPALVSQLRAAGYAVPQMPGRHLDRIRAAAMHPTPKDPLPTTDEVAWFREAARAYFLHRADVVK